MIMLGTHVTDFAYLIEIVERINADIRDAKLSSPHIKNSLKKGQVTKKKESDVNYVQPIRTYQINPILTKQSIKTKVNRGQIDVFNEEDKGLHDQQIIACGQIFAQQMLNYTKDLLAAQLLGPRPARVMNPPYPA